jgi:hypothetical protein
MHNVKYYWNHKDELVIMLGYFILLELGSDNVSVKKYV